MKRTSVVILRMNDVELLHLEQLQKFYSSSGTPATKSFLVRDALNRLPFQQNSLSA